MNNFYRHIKEVSAKVDKWLDWKLGKHASILKNKGEKKMSKILIEYVRKSGFKKKNNDGKWNRGNKNDEIISVVVATDKNQIGWAQCNKKMDTFTKKRGLEVAIGRALKYEYSELDIYSDSVGYLITYNDFSEKRKVAGRINYQLRNAMEAMNKRANAYFKSEKVYNGEL